MLLTLAVIVILGVVSGILAAILMYEHYVRIERAAKQKTFRGEHGYAHREEVAETPLGSIPGLAYRRSVNRSTMTKVSNHRGGVILLNIIISGGRYPGWFNIFTLILIIAILGLFTLLVASYPTTQAGITIGLGIASLMFLSLGVLGKLLESNGYGDRGDQDETRGS